MMISCVVSIDQLGHLKHEKVQKMLNKYIKNRLKKTYFVLFLARFILSERLFNFGSFFNNLINYFRKTEKANDLNFAHK
jgi:hypothetical protein